MLKSRTKLPKIQRFESKVQTPPSVFHPPIWGMKITVIGNDTSGGERSNRIQMTHETVFHLLASNNQLLPRGCSRVESVCTGWKGRVVREGAIRCSVLAKLKTGWKLMGVRTVIAKYLHAGPGISIKVNPSRRRLAPPPGSSPFDRGNGIFFADKSRGVWGERDFEGVPIEFFFHLSRLRSANV